MISKRRKKTSSTSEYWQQQRENIVAAAGSLFAEKGYMGTSLDEIAAACNLNKATLYYYYKSKAAILYDATIRFLLGITEENRPITESALSPEEKLKRIVINHVRWHLSHPSILGIGTKLVELDKSERRHLPSKLLQPYLKLRNDYNSIFEIVIKEGMDDKSFRPIDIRVATFFTLGFLNSINKWYKSKDGLTVDEVSSEAWNYIYNALKHNNISKRGGG